MKELLTACTAALALLSFAALAHAQPGCVKAEVQNLRTGQGPLMVAAYVDAASFRKTAASQMQIAVTGETMQIQVCGLVGETAALLVYQDLNGNGTMDANPFGMPTEPWGSSGRSPPMSGPTWATAQVPLGADAIVLKLGK